MTLTQWPRRLTTSQVACEHPPPPFRALLLPPSRLLMRCMRLPLAGKSVNVRRQGQRSSQATTMRTSAAGLAVESIDSGLSLLQETRVNLRG